MTDAESGEGTGRVIPKGSVFLAVMGGVMWFWLALFGVVPGVGDLATLALEVLL